MLWGRGRRCKALAARFVAAVNAHDLDAFAGLITDDFTYIDSLREGVVGHAAALEAARTLFDKDPGIFVEVESVSFSDPYVLMRGWAHSADPEFGRRRAAWRARCEDGALAEWQSWAEGGPPHMSRTYAPDAAVDLSSRAASKPA
ncbi:DUF4440 domain-containing protein [Altererythrobacter aerius]|uniref:DUF4440 domain-containing protein n=1 Tax=Tsuneonella aeria TaxID=1837929 RepID=A0A6I4TCH5_9SPHN|nr:nuclear transport factor 2 family protein [Tsuneonella aeria]MXO74484.1 DUF4440 domain-containing protein [Tsuneonella aeria]